MPRLRDEATAVIVNVDDDTAARLKAEGWVPAETTQDPPEDTQPPQRKRGRPRKQQ